MEDNNQVQQKPTFQGKTQCFKGITPSTGLLPAVVKVLQGLNTFLCSILVGEFNKH